MLDKFTNPPTEVVMPPTKVSPPIPIPPTTTNAPVLALVAFIVDVTTNVPSVRPTNLPFPLPSTPIEIGCMSPAAVILDHNLYVEDPLSHPKSRKLELIGLSTSNVLQIRNRLEAFPELLPVGGTIPRTVSVLVLVHKV